MPNFTLLATICLPIFFDFNNEESELVDDTVWIKPDMTVESAVD